MAGESVGKKGSVQHTFTILEQTEQWLEIIKKMEFSELAYAIHPITAKVQQLRDLEVCGVEDQQVSILKRLVVLRGNLKLFGPELDAAIMKRVQALSQKAGNGVSRQTMRVDLSNVCSSHRLESCHTGGKTMNSPTLVLDGKGTAYQLCPRLLPSGPVQSNVDDAWSIQRDLVDSIYLLDNVTVRVYLYWDRCMTLRARDRFTGDLLVHDLEQLTGKKCKPL